MNNINSKAYRIKCCLFYPPWSLGVDGWIRTGPELFLCWQQELKLSMNLTHPDDELGLCTAAVEADFDHVARLKGYTNLVTR